MRRIKGLPVERRWRKQMSRANTDTCPHCGKQSFPCYSAAKAAGEQLTKIYGGKQRFVYEAHGKIHLTTLPQEEVSFGQGDS